MLLDSLYLAINGIEYEAKKRSKRTTKSINFSNKYLIHKTLETHNKKYQKIFINVTM